MTQNSREFQVFVKPVGAACNLRCHYCYYLEKEDLYRTDFNKPHYSDNSGYQVNSDHPNIPDNHEKPGQRGNRTVKRHRMVRMSDDLLERYIICHINATTEPVINFSWHGGEPVLAGIDFYKKAVELQKRHMPEGKSFVNGIQTNGILLDDKWFRFLAEEKFIVGISIDGPERFHNIYRITRSRQPTFSKVLETYRQLQDHGIVMEVLCVVHAGNVGNPLEVYSFFRELGTGHITFLPLVTRQPGNENCVTEDSVTSEGFGDFMISIFDEWVKNDIGKIKVQLFEEAARTAFNQDHTLCIFKEICGGVPVVEHNGDFYSCDHYVDREHLVGNIVNTGIKELLISSQQIDFGMGKLKTLPRFCLVCEVRSMCNGECPKNRFINTPDGEQGLNYLCAGYRKFFNHCRPWVEAVAEAWKYKNRPGSPVTDQNQSLQKKVNRNAPCPCGSGKKYKRCCLSN